MTGSQMISLWKKSWLLWCLLLLSAAALADHRAVDAEKGEITLALSAEPPTLNSLKATDSQSFQILDHITEGLLTFDHNNQLAGAVAERWELREDGATFWLRQDARWSDGQAVTAGDFVFAWQQMVNPKTAAQYASILYPIKNAEQINHGALPPDALGVKAVDDFTLEVEFENPCAYFLQLTTFISYRPIRADFYQQQGERYAADAEDLLFNGPFTLTRWVHGASLRLEKNPRYWNHRAVTLNAIEMPYITSDAGALVNLFRDGNIALTGLDAATLKEALKHHLKIHRFTDGMLYFVEFNHRPERATHNLALRKAIQLMFDPNEIVNKVVAVPGNLPAWSLFPSWLMEDAAPVPPTVTALESPFSAARKLHEEHPPTRIEADPELARRYLEQAKQELGVSNIPPLVLLLGDSPGAGKQGEYLQSRLADTLGLELKLDKQIFKQRLAKMSRGEFDLVATGWGPDYNDPMTFADLFASWNDNNHGRYQNPDYDRLVRQAQSTTDAGIRIRAFADLQQLVHDEVVILPQYERGVIYVQSPNLTGVIRRRFGGDPNFAYTRIVE